MQTIEFLQDLNDSQKAAVEYIDGPSLVIAGAGSGKTRVLTYKIAYLLTQGIKPWEIMALTFTNKAAKEMKERIGNLVGQQQARYLRMGTFHSVFAQILRSEATKIGYGSNFTIYDEADSRSLCKAIIKELGLDEKTYRPADVHCRISEAKNRLILAPDYMVDHEAQARDFASKMPQMANIYKVYSERCRLSNAMDFDDLLVNTFLLLKNNDEIREKYANGFRYFLVDEYQDTNYAQQQIILQLSSAHQHVCVVGDDAQSIYGFRGANIDNILDFQKHYQGALLFKLEQNYRSTKRIVEAANSLIHKNERQIDKTVFSKNDDGENITLTELASDREEAIYVCNDIKKKIRAFGFTHSDFAILYRTNYQSRTFEEQLMKQNIPYKIYGGLSFYQRKEIKDVVAYLRLIANPDDEEALKRIVNYPARGIGDTTVQKVAQAARDANMTMWQVIANPEMTSLNVNKGTITKLKNFRLLIESFIERLVMDDAFTLGKDILKQAGITQDIYSSTEPEYLSKQEHLEEFMSSMQEFVQLQKEQGEPTGLLDFLHEVALLSDREDTEDNQPKVVLMTIHSAKGLEFPCVYVGGMEENIFPTPLSVNSKRELEEERRLLYVAITRAEKYCTLTYAKSRYRYGKMEFDSPSRFLRDIDSRLITFDGMGSKSSVSSGRGGRSFSSGSFDDFDDFRFSGRRGFFGMQNSKPVASQFMADPKPRVTHPEKPKVANPYTDSFAAQLAARGTNMRKVERALSTGGSSPITTQGTSSTKGIVPGATVKHNRFGVGVIKSIEGSGENAKAVVDFRNEGTRQLLLKFAKLEVL